MKKFPRKVMHTTLHSNFFHTSTYFSFHSSWTASCFPWKLELCIDIHVPFLLELFPLYINGLLIPYIRILHVSFCTSTNNHGGGYVSVVFNMTRSLKLMLFLFFHIQYFNPFAFESMFSSHSFPFEPFS